MAVLIVAGVVLVADLARPPDRQLSGRAMVTAIRLYQRTLSSLVARAGVRCRFEPSCSRYAVAAIEHDGALVGGGRVAWRLLRCGPWTAAGTLDPPPDAASNGERATASAGALEAEATK